MMNIDGVQYIPLNHTQEALRGAVDETSLEKGGRGPLTRQQKRLLDLIRVDISSLFPSDWGSNKMSTLAPLAVAIKPVQDVGAKGDAVAAKKQAAQAQQQEQEGGDSIDARLAGDVPQIVEVPPESEK